MSDDAQEKQVEQATEQAQTAEQDSLTERMTQQIEQAEKLDEDTKGLAKSWVTLMTNYLGVDRGFQIDRNRIDSALEELDRVISRQMDEIIHNDTFKTLESAWRGLYWLVERTDFDQNIKIDLVSAGKQELLDDFKDTGGDVKLSGLYKHIYRSEYGTPNGKPFGSIIANYEFAHGDADLALLQNMAELATMSHSPLIGGVSGELFGPKGFEHLNDVDYSVKDQLAGKAYAKWNGFREDENAKYVGLVMPHFMLRSPYNYVDERRQFNYNENLGGDNNNYLWGNAAFAFASRLTESFAKYRWCWRIVGEESGGAVTDLSMHVFEQNGETVQKPPTDVPVVFSSENELYKEGLIPLSWLKDKDQGVFYRAPSFARAKEYPNTPDGNKKTADEKLRTYLPYAFIISRFAHYLKRLQTKWIGRPTTATALQKELNKWIFHYVNHQEKHIGKYPLYDAGVTIESDERDPGVFHCDFWMIPHKLPTGFRTKLRLVSQQEGLKE